MCRDESRHGTHECVRYDVMAAPRKSTVRFQERAELLDFLLEVSAATAETLDLDRIMANVATIVKEVIPYDVFAILLHAERLRGRITCASHYERTTIGEGGCVTRDKDENLGRVIELHRLQGEIT